MRKDRVILSSSNLSAVFSLFLHYMAKIGYLVAQHIQYKDLKVFTCVCLLSAGVCRRFWSLPRHVGRRRTLGDLFSTGFGQGGKHTTLSLYRDGLSLSPRMCDFCMCQCMHCTVCHRPEQSMNQGIVTQVSLLLLLLSLFVQYFPFTLFLELFHVIIFVNKI